MQLNQYIELRKNSFFEFSFFIFRAQNVRQCIIIIGGGRSKSLAMSGQVTNSFGGPQFFKIPQGPSHYRDLLSHKAMCLSRCKPGCNFIAIFLMPNLHFNYFFNNKPFCNRFQRDCSQKGIHNCVTYKSKLIFQFQKLNFDFKVGVANFFLIERSKVYESFFFPNDICLVARTEKIPNKINGTPLIKSQNASLINDSILKNKKKFAKIYESISNDDEDSCASC